MSASTILKKRKRIAKPPAKPTKDNTKRWHNARSGAPFGRPAK